MFCKNCGNQMDDNAAVCVNCGCPKGQGNTHCFNCGVQIDPNMAVCMNCGAPTNNVRAAVPGAKSKVAAGLLGIFLGSFGVHNFYLGYTSKAIIQLSITVGAILLTIITCGVAGVITPFITLGVSIWGLIEGIMILTGSIAVDGQGNPLSD